MALVFSEPFILHPPQEHERRHEGGRGYAEKNTAVHPSDRYVDIHEIIYTDHHHLNETYRLHKQTQSDEEKKTFGSIMMLALHIL